MFDLPKRRPRNRQRANRGVEPLEDRLLLTAPLSFLPPVSYPVGSQPISVALGDLDGDTILDIVTANLGSLPRDPGSVTVWFGDGTGGFAGRMDVPMGSLTPVDVALARLDADADLDIVTVSGDTVSVLLNQGDTFPMRSDIVVEVALASIVSGDIDGDGDVDLAVKLANINLQLQILLNDGNGNFAVQPAINLGNSRNPWFLAGADFNRDGRYDLVLPNSNFSSDAINITVLLSNGDGTFTPTDYPDTMDPVWGAAGDINGDGFADIVTLETEETSGGRVTALLNSGTGSFGARISSPLAVSALALPDLGDVNGDGLTDLVFTIFGTEASDFENVLSVVPGNGDGTFGSAMVFPMQKAIDAAVGDLDGDMDIDVVTLFYDPAAVTVLLNNAGPPLPPPDTDSDGVPDPVEDAAPNGGDGNRDGMPDSEQDNVASLPNAVDALYVTLAAPTGTRLKNVRDRDLSPPVGVALPLGAFDYTIDGITSADGSAAVTMFLPPELTVDSFYNFGVTRDDPLAHWFEFQLDAATSTGAEIFDDDGDTFADRIVVHFVDGGRGDSDLARDGKVVDPGAPALITLSGLGHIFGTAFHDVDGDGVLDGFGDPSRIGFVPFEPALPGWTVYLDLNGDGVLNNPLGGDDICDSDSAEPCTLTDDGGQYSFTGLARRTYTVAEVRQPNWDETAPALFSPAAHASLSLPPNTVAAGDINDDGLEDVVAVVDSGVEILLNWGGGQFESASTFSATYSPEMAALGRFDTDSLLDLAVTATLFNEVHVFLGNGDGTFTPAARAAYTVGEEPLTIVAVDINNDTVLDLVVANTNDVSVLLGNGDGTFQDEKRTPVDGAPRFLAVGHFNPGAAPGLDNFLDLAVPLINRDSVSVLLGNGDGTFRLRSSPAVGDAPQAIAVGQFNGDDHLDLVTADLLADTVTFRFGDGTGDFPGLFGDPSASLTMSVGDRPRSVAVVDFDRDGRDDVAVVNQDGGTVTLLAQRTIVTLEQTIDSFVPAGTLSVFGSHASASPIPLIDSFVPAGTLSVGSRPRFVAVSEMNNDGDPDLLVARRDAGVAEVVILFGNPRQYQYARLGDDPIVDRLNFGNHSEFGGEIHGTVWEDLDGDGAFEGIEPRRSGTVVFLDINRNGLQDRPGEPAAATDENGEYAFFNLPPGTYAVGLRIASGADQTFPVDSFHTVMLRPNEPRTGVNFGVQTSTGTIRGFVWDDLNGNGIRDNPDGDLFFDEPGQSGVTVYLDLNENGRFDPSQGEPSQMTGPAGEYVFADLSADQTYVVAEVIPAGFARTFPAAGSPQGHRVELEPNETATVNFGNAAVAEIRGTKWTDQNANGVPDLDEPRAAGATVFVDANQNGLLDPGEPSAVTATDGTYTMGNLAPGSHLVTDQIVRWFFSPDANVGRSFGFSVASVGGNVLVGDPQAIREDPGLPAFSEMGRVYLIDAATGVLVRELGDTITTRANDQFGFSLAVVGNMVAVGIPGKRNGQVVVLDATDGALLDVADPPGDGTGNFGTSVAAADSDVFLGVDGFVVGAPGAAEPDSPGWVGLFMPPADRGGCFGKWTHVIGRALFAGGDEFLCGGVSSFDPSNPQPQVGDDFGESVAGVDDGILVGDPRSDVGAGTVRLLAAANGLLRLTIPNPTPEVNENFGVAVAGFGNDLLVGAPADNLGASTAGAAYLFDGETGTLLQTFTNPTPAPGDRFGFAVAAVGNYVVVGAPHDDTVGRDAGAVYVFEGATGQFVRAIHSPFLRPGADFGFALAAAGENQILIGAPSVADSLEAGSVFLFDLGRLRRQVTLAPGQILEQVDFASVPATQAEPLPAIRGTVFDDRDGDGQLDSGEPALPRRSVFLDLNEDQVANPGEPIRQTDALGGYEFLALRPGNYTVAEQLPAGWAPTVPTGSSLLRFDFGSRLPGGDNPISIIASELNGDQRLDLVLFGSELSVLLADPTTPGTFQPAVAYSTVASRGLAADLNGDGLRDLVTSNTILFNNPLAPGSFGPPMDVDVAPNLRSVAAGDWNNDGLADLAVTSSDPFTPSTNLLFIMFNNPDQAGTFFPAGSYDVAVFPGSVITGDWNGDWLPDLAVGDVGDGHVAVLLNDTESPGSFLAPAIYETPQRVVTLETADLNSDGLPDLVYGGSGGTANVLLNRFEAPGQFGENVEYVVDLQLVEVADMGGDGLADLVLIDQSVGLLVMSNDPVAPGTFLDPVVHTPVESLRYLLVVDLNNDTLPEAPAVFFSQELAVGVLKPIHLAVRQGAVVSAHQVVNNVNFGNVQDGDADGVSNSVEEAHAPNGDGNDDGVADSEQLHVTSLPAARGGGNLTMASALGTRLVNVRTFEALAPRGSGPFAFFLPVGAVGFTLERFSTSSSPTVELFLHSNPVVNTYYKFGKIPNNQTPHVYEFLFDGTTGAEFFDAAGQAVPPHTNSSVARVVLHLVDGQRGDDDLMANGIIVDPGGPAVILNSPPTASTNGPSAGVRGQPLEFAFSANDPDPADQSGTFNYRIDWNGDGTVDESVDGPATAVMLRHVFPATGTFNVTVTTTDPGGLTSPLASHAVSIAPVALLGPDLIVGGTLGDDSIRFVSGKRGAVSVKINRDTFGPFFPTRTLVAFGQAGDDTISVVGKTRLTTRFDGGEGHDHLVGTEKGHNLLVGGAGDDSLQGGKSGRNILIGGAGRDQLIGKDPKNNLLIGGTTAFDANDQALAAILAEWTSSAKLATRIAHLTNGGGLNGPHLLVKGTTVLDDLAVDELLGGNDLDRLLLFPNDVILPHRRASRMQTLHLLSARLCASANLGPACG